jgi:small subunit ribosomal protein S20
LAVKKKSRTVVKRLRSSARKAEFRGRVRTSTRTFLKKAHAAVASGQVEDATQAVQEAVSALDKAAEKGVIHKNNAARHKSRLMAALNKKAQPAA